MSYNFPLCSREACYGCWACVDACPQEALSLVEGEDTYLHVCCDPLKCIGCDLCKSVCPRLNIGDRGSPVASVAAIHKDEEVRSRSSSGGAFTALVEIISEIHGGKKKIFVCGAELTEDFKVRHKCVRYARKESALVFAKSKYICSNCGGIYNHIKKLLRDSDNFIVFSGTPCQVAALLLSVGGKQENLLSVDFACHGALSQKLFDYYRREMEHDSKSPLKCYMFRNKEVLPNGTVYSRSAKLVFANGKCRFVTRYDDPFMALYYNEKAPLRESCYNCGFAGPKRASDISLCDAWGINNLYPELNPFEGVSGIIFNTDRVMNIADRLAEKMHCYKCDFCFFQKHNSTFANESHGNMSRLPIKARDNLFEGVSNGRRFSDLVKSYYVDSNQKLERGRR